ncbi:MAG: DNRLRE domain-containing protein [Pseudomonadota bacterium]
MKKGILALAAFMLMGVHAGATSLSPTVDFYSFAGGFSDNDRLIVNNPGAGAAFESVAFMDFDVSSLAGQTITSATLVMEMYCNPGLTCTGDSAGSFMDISVNEVGIDVETVTDAAGAAVLMSSIGSVVDTVVASTPGVYTWDLTSLVASWVADPSSSNGFAITARGAGNGTFNNYFYSSIATGGMMPVLQIEATPVPVPAAIWLLGSALLGLVARRR